MASNASNAFTPIGVVELQTTSLVAIYLYSIATGEPNRVLWVYRNVDRSRVDSLAEKYT